MDRYASSSATPGKANATTVAAAALWKTLLVIRRNVESHISQLSACKDQIQSLRLMFEQDEIQKAVKHESARLAGIEAALVALSDDPSTGMARRSYRWIVLKWDQRSARRALDEAHSHLMLPEVLAERTARIKRHNDVVHQKQSVLPRLNRTLDAKLLRKDRLAGFDKVALHALAAVVTGSWKHDDFHGHLVSTHTHLRNGDIEQATRSAGQMRFQRKPADSLVQAWQKEARKMLDNANTSQVGYRETGKYTALASRSVQLAANKLVPEARHSVEAFAHPADRWQALAEKLIPPANLTADPLWAIYWAMFRFSQRTSNFLYEAEEHEDMSNGAVCTALHIDLSEWAGPHVRQLGYPEATSYFGVFKVASSSEETRLGADIGLLIDIDIGPLKCRKVARIQAKKALEGKADVGSTSGQLPKLMAVAGLGYYLFYHRRQHPIRPQGPTVCSAKEFADWAGSSAKSIKLTVHELGWDWMSFIAFGLCAPDSDIGVTFDDVDDGMTKLGGGSIQDLPKYLQTIAITDAASVGQLRERIATRYREQGLEQKTARTVTREKSQQQTRDRGMGL
jgi:hypothetical protein